MVGVGRARDTEVGQHEGGAELGHQFLGRVGTGAEPAGEVAGKAVGCAGPVHKLVGESRALAGYLQCTDSSRLAFAILVDDHLPGNPADRETMDQIVAIIAQNARGTAQATAACVP